MKSFKEDINTLSPLELRKQLLPNTQFTIHKLTLTNNNTIEISNNDTTTPNTNALTTTITTTNDITEQIKDPLLFDSDSSNSNNANNNVTPINYNFTPLHSTRSIHFQIISTQTISIECGPKN